MPSKSKYRLISTALLCLWALLVLGSAAYAEQVNYISLNQLAQKYNLRHEKDTITGREIYTGDGFNIVAANGMSSIMVNNKLTMLDNRVKSVSGQIALSQPDYDKVDKLFVKPPAQKEKPVEKIRLLRKVVIDPGHGGNFRGCKSRDGLLEKDINLDIAKRLRDLLEDSGVKVVLTRTTDRSLSSNLNEDLRSRVEVANREAPDLFISIHCNWSDESSVNGFEIYYSPENNTVPELNSRVIGESKPEDAQTQRALVHILKNEFTRRTLEMAGEVKKQLDKMPTGNRGVRKANFRVIKYCEYPCILVETDYLSNCEVAEKFRKESYRQEIAEKIKQAILSYGK